MASADDRHSRSYLLPLQAREIPAPETYGLGVTLRDRLLLYHRPSGRNVLW